MDPARIRENATIAREQILRCRGITQHFLRLQTSDHNRAKDRFRHIRSQPEQVR